MAVARGAVIKGDPCWFAEVTLFFVSEKQAGELPKLPLVEPLKALPGLCP